MNLFLRNFLTLGLSLNLFYSYSLLAESEEKQAEDKYWETRRLQNQQEQKEFERQQNDRQFEQRRFDDQTERKRVDRQRDDRNSR